MDGIGDVLTKVIEDALEMSDAAWSTLFPKLPLYAPVEGGTTYNPVRVTWYPSSEPDAPMGTVIEGHSLEVPEA